MQSLEVCSLSQPSVRNRLAVVVRDLCVSLRLFVSLGLCVPSGVGSRLRLSNNSYDRYMALTELLTYTIERLDVGLPFGNVAVSLAKKAPSSPTGERLAAARFSLTGCRSSW